MDSDLHLNHRRVKDRAAELHRQAELHRLATRTRADRKLETPRQPTLQIPSPVTGIASVVQRVTAAIRAAKA